MFLVLLFSHYIKSLFKLVIIISGIYIIVVLLKLQILPYKTILQTQTDIVLEDIEISDAITFVWELIWMI